MPLAHIWVGGLPRVKPGEHPYVAPANERGRTVDNIGERACVTQGRRTMDARITKEETAIMLSLGMRPRTQAVDEIRMAALRARDEAIGNAVKNAFRNVFRGIGVALAFVASYPERSRTLHQLAGLSDRELADIGLERSDLSRVFDADFAVPGRAAQQQPATARALAA
jgi:uncharacterized protein YjiS (DUF1127 family)